MIEDRVVTLGSLDGRLAQTRRLVLPPGAVLTPSVKDELRKRRVHVEYRAADVAPSASRPWPAARCTPHAERSATLLASSVRARRRVDDAQWPKRQGVGVWVATDHRLGLLVTDDPLGGVCLANRYPAVRAA